MSYTVIKGVSQLDIEAKEIDDKIYLPLEALWEDYTILKEQKVIFMDSPLAGLEVGLINVNNKKGSPENAISQILSGAGCKVTPIDENTPIPTTVNLILELNPAEGIFQTGYGGFTLNGSRRLAKDIGWAVAKIFELDYILPPIREKSILKKNTFWQKLTIPIISLKWRQIEDSDLLIAISILLGLFRFASTKLPLIEERIFLPKEEVEEVSDMVVSDSKVSVSESVWDVNIEDIKSSIVQEAQEQSVPYIGISQENKLTGKDEISYGEFEEVGDEMAKKKNVKKKQGKMVTDPSPKLQAYMKKIIAEQNQKAQIDKASKMGKVAPEDVYKKAGLGKG